VRRLFDKDRIALLERGPIHENGVGLVPAGHRDKLAAAADLYVHVLGNVE
jgi:hypothetical protein